MAIENDVSFWASNFTNEQMRFSHEEKKFTSVRPLDTDKTVTLEIESFDTIGNVKAKIFIVGCKFLSNFDWKDHSPL